jgi:hypothetical protein
MHDLLIHCMLNWALTMLEERVSAMAIGATNTASRRPDLC